jgi:hydrogenase nickel incorporation protein HypA/HybF
MHEVSICESILDVLMEEAAKNKASRINQVTLKIGEMAGVVEDALRFAFEVVTEGTLAEGAKLTVIDVPLTAKCRSCGNEFHVVGYAFSCKRCDSPEIEIISGREMLIEEIDLEA